jgi:hypothetical protein
VHDIARRARSSVGSLCHCSTDQEATVAALVRRYGGVVRGVAESLRVRPPAQ